VPAAPTASGVPRLSRSATASTRRDEVVSIAAPPIRPVQIFGTRKSADTRKALRFFAERRVATHFVDFQERGPALGELRRFSERFGVSTLVDRESRRFLDLGLQRSMHSDDWWLKRLTEEPRMLKQPLVRFGHQVTIGLDESTWRAWLA
jgi:arsenate reductase-like glutaredoxin family protein